MFDDLNCTLPLTGAGQYITAVLTGMLLGAVLNLINLASQKAVINALMLKDKKILKTILTALITAIIALPFLTEIKRIPVPEELDLLHIAKSLKLFPPPAPGDFWQSLIAGALTGTGLFLSGRTLLSSLAAVGKGEFHALAFLAGAVGTVLVFDECDFVPAKWFKKFDFSTGILPSRTGFSFFDPEMFCFWVTVFLAAVLAMVYISSFFSKKEE